MDVIDSIGENNCDWIFGLAEKLVHSISPSGGES
jgi:hypothetical protein